MKPDYAALACCAVQCSLLAIAALAVWWFGLLAAVMVTLGAAMLAARVLYLFNFAGLRRREEG
jgi:hypothetical protein